MPNKLQVGERYATATGLPVLLVGMQPDYLLLQSLATDNQIAVPVTGLVREVKRRASAACKGKNVAANIRARMY